MSIIHSKSNIGKNVAVGSGCIIHPHVNIENTVDRDEACIIGSRTIVEELSRIVDSSIGCDCLIEIGCTITKSIIGDSTIINSKAVITNCKIGNNCHISSAFILDGIEVPGGTSVYWSQSTVMFGKANTDSLVNIVKLYHQALSDPSSPQYQGQS